MEPLLVVDYVPYPRLLHSTAPASSALPSDCLALHSLPSQWKRIRILDEAKEPHKKLKTGFQAGF